jgi:hypothetical protein
MSKTISVTAAQSLDEFRLRIAFSDGVVQEVDFRGFLQRSNHPEIRAFLDAKKFNTYSVQDGDLVWGDWELCFPVMDLYQNNIEHAPYLKSAA